MGMAVTAKQIAKKLGVSEATVSLALNGRPGVSALTKRKVLACARELGYDLSRKDRHDSGPKTICLVRHVRSMREEAPFIDEMVEGVQESVLSSGNRFMTVAIDAMTNIEDQLSQLRLSTRELGVVVTGTELLESEWPAYARLGLPIVVLDGFFPSIDADFATINNIQGAYRAAQVLVREGRGCPGRLTSALDLRNFRERRNGFMTAIHDAGFSSTRVLTHVLGSTVEDAEREMSLIIESGAPLAKGYFADFDQIAIGAVRAFMAHGIRVPEDVSVIGFDDVEMSRYLEPPLSTIHVDKKHLGRVAVERLLKIMEPGEHLPVRIEVSTSYVERGTTR